MGKQSPEITQVFSPRPANVLPRERLFRALDDLSERKVLWIGGPPGAGKTTLVASYLGSRRLQALWVTLEPGDPEARALFDRFGLASPCSASFAVAPAAAAGRRRLRELFDRVPRSAVLVLDDCHTLGEEAPLHAFLADTAAHLPQGSRLILIGRGEPPDAYTRAIASGALAVLDARELRFTPEETRAFAQGCHPDARVLAALCSECEGSLERTGDVLERCGELEASAALRIRSRDWEGLLNLLRRHGRGLLAQGRTLAVRKWVAAFPTPFAAESPWVHYWAGAATVVESPVAARASLGKAWSGFEARADRIGQLLTAAAVIETYQFEWSTYEPADAWIDRMQTLLEEVWTLESPEGQLHVLANWLFALTRVRPQPRLAASCMVQLRALLDVDIEVNQWLFVARWLLLAHGVRGDLESAATLAERMRSMLESPGCTSTTRTAALNAMAYTSALSGGFAEVGRLLQEARRTAAAQSLTVTDPLYHEARQLAAFARNDSEELLEVIQALRRVIGPGAHFGMSLLSSALAQQALERGDRAAAVNLRVAAVSNADAAALRPLRWMSRLALAASLAAQSDTPEAARVLHEAGEIEGEPGEPGQREHDLLSAYLALRRGRREACHALLTRALPATGRGSRAFVCFPREMAELCLEALQSGIAAHPVRELIKQYRLRPPSKASDAWPWPFKVFVLGRFRVLKDGVPIRSSRRAQRKPLELLQALIAFGGIEVGAGALTDALWPESEGDAGYHALESALYRLRQMLGAPDAVTMAGGKLTLDPQQFWVDIWAFESELLTAEARRAEPAQRLQRMRELYGGHFLEHESEKPWALKSRLGLREKFVRSIREIARDYETRQRWQEAVHVYQTGIEVDSLAEDLHRGLILCHRELGDHVAALQAYRRCSELLNRLLGVQPTAKTLALYQSVRQAAVGAPG